MKNHDYTRSIKQLSLEERPREKARLHGIDTLAPCELLAIIIGSGTPGESVVDLSRRMLEHYDNSLQRLATASADELSNLFHGIGEAKALTIKAAIRLAQLYADEKYIPTQVRCAEDAYNLLRGKLQSCPHEEFWVVFLNNAKRVISKSRIGQGGLTSTAVDIRIIMKMAIDSRATSMILYHNHPSGSLQPSAQDNMLTQRVCEAAKTLDIPVIDHIIISSIGYYSYQAEGKL